MKAQSKRLEELENKSNIKKLDWEVIYQDEENESRYSYKDKETGELEYMTLEEAESRFKDKGVFIVRYISMKNA